MSVVLPEPAQQFIAGLERCNCAVAVEHGIVSFGVRAVVGEHLGNNVETGVAIDELVGWPIAPPHWVHFPDWVRVGKTNARPSTQPGWLMHSRNIIGWGSAREPAQEWLAHVQAVLQGDSG